MYVSQARSWLGVNAISSLRGPLSAPFCLGRSNLYFLHSAFGRSVVAQLQDLYSLYVSFGSGGVDGCCQPTNLIRVPDKPPKLPSHYLHTSRIASIVTSQQTNGWRTCLLSAGAEVLYPVDFEF